MRKSLMATVALSLALGQAGSALAQSAPGGQANAEMFYMIQQLQQEVRRLQGEVEEQRNQIDRLSRQSRDRYIDLDQRILDLSGKLDGQGGAQPAPSAGNDGGESPAGESPQATPTQEYRQPDAKERAAYQEIQALIREQKDYDAAIGKLYDFIGEYPEGDLTVNAYYWLGEVYLVQPKLEQAKQAFTIVATRYADHRKASDAVYKLGVTNDRLGDKVEARRQMEKVVKSYPNSGAAKLAGEYLAAN